MVECVRVSSSEGYRIRRDGFIIIYGLTDSGKTNLMFRIIQCNIDQFDCIYFCVPNGSFQEIYRDITHESFFLSYDNIENDIEGLIQDQLLPENKERHIAVFLDDIIGSVEMRHSGKCFDKLATSCRHARMTVFVLTQKYNYLSLTQRENSKTVLVTKARKSAISSLFDSIGSDFSNEKQFESFIMDNCKNYNVVKFDLLGKIEKPLTIFHQDRLDKKIFIKQ